MTKIFKQLARHWAVCLVVFALLFVQAYCDLSLPDYTSKIVDTGIQQGGIESPLPDTVRQSTLDALSLLMREEDAAAFQNAYTADGDVLRLRGRHDAELLAGRTDETDLAVPDLFVDLMHVAANTEAPPIQNKNANALRIRATTQAAHGTLADAVDLFALRVR
jgi:ATP-binding cassette subfamily B protein